MDLFGCMPGSCVPLVAETPKTAGPIDAITNHTPPTTPTPTPTKTSDEATFQFPMLRAEGLKGAIIYYDGQMNDTRMGLTVALTATQHGAVVANRVKVTQLLKDGKGELCGAKVCTTIYQTQIRTPPIKNPSDRPARIFARHAKWVTPHTYTLSL